MPFETFFTIDLVFLQIILTFKKSNLNDQFLINTDFPKLADFLGNSPMNTQQRVDTATAGPKITCENGRIN
jgi:hypothetical protein